MKTLTELKSMASKYAEERKQKSINLYEPIFRLENNKLVLGYMLLEFDDNYGIKRPTEWILQNIDDGEIIELNNIETKDFSNQNELPLNKVFQDSGMSPLYDEINSITSSFDKWRKKILSDLGSNDINPISYINDNQILLIDDEFISPKDFIIVNSEEVFSNMYNQLFEIGKTISESYNNFHNNLFERIRCCYLSGSINIEIIKQYLNFLKYSFPETLELLNKFNNIDGTSDVEYDNKIIEMIKHKKNLSNNGLISKIDDKLKEIESTYNPDNLKDIEVKNENETTIKDIISKIDEQLESIRGEDK